MKLTFFRTRRWNCNFAEKMAISISQLTCYSFSALFLWVVIALLNGLVDVKFLLSTKFVANGNIDSYLNRIKPDKDAVHRQRVMIIWTIWPWKVLQSKVLIGFTSSVTMKKMHKRTRFDSSICYYSDSWSNQMRFLFLINVWSNNRNFSSIRFFSVSLMLNVFGKSWQKKMKLAIQNTKSGIYFHSQTEKNHQSQTLSPEQKSPLTEDLSFLCS